jgi:outer membrane protein assembly factor BamB
MKSWKNIFIDVSAARLRMLRITPVAVWLGCLLALPVFASTSNWPQFRGPQATGVSEAPAPSHWNVETGENIRWQTPIPGLGHSCPIVWGSDVFITTAVKPGDKPKLKPGLYGDVSSYKETEKHQWRLLRLNKSDGKIVWDKLCLEAVPRSERHTKASHCNSTPATDGEHIVAVLGSEGLFCFDMGGKQLWRKDLGRMKAGWYTTKDTEWGFGSSPVLYEGKIVLQCDVDSEQFVAAFDVKDGHELWRTARKDVPTWSTPLPVVSNGRAQVVCNGWKEIAGYDLKTGKRLWWLTDGGDIPVASPVFSGEFIILTSGHGKYRPMRAIRTDASGDISPASIDQASAGVVWSKSRKGNYLSTPIVVGELLWGDLDGVVTCFDVKTGDVQYSERIGDGGEAFTDAPVSAGGKLYFTGEQGHVYVVPATKEFSVIATNKLGGLCFSTPAISDGTIFFRTTEKLVAVGGSSK